MTGPFSHVYELHHLNHPQLVSNNELLTNSSNLVNSTTPSGYYYRRWIPSRILVVASLALFLWVWFVWIEVQEETEAHQDKNGHSNFSFAYSKWDAFDDEQQVLQASQKQGQEANTTTGTSTNTEPSSFVVSDPPVTAAATLFRNAPIPTLIHLRRNEVDDNNSQSGPSDASDRSINNNNDLSTNPQIYGWTPEMYPNPLLDPVRCSIAFLPEEQQAIMKRAFSNNKGEEEQDGDIPDPLRLCDPDWMLGGMYMEQIAFALRNFSDFFSQPDWDVNVGSTGSINQDDRNNGEEAAQNVTTATSSLVISNSEEHAALSKPRVQLAVATVRKVR